MLDIEAKGKANTVVNLRTFEHLCIFLGAEWRQFSLEIKNLPPRASVTVTNNGARQQT
jgi:hypothetical protein